MVLISSFNLGYWIGCYFLSTYGIVVNNFSLSLNFWSLELGLREISKLTESFDY